MRFPADRFSSLADHAAWRSQNAAGLQDRALAEAAAPESGTCAPCLRACVFAAGHCDCPDFLDAAGRALLHLAVSEGGLCGWTRLHLMGARGASGDRMAELAGDVVSEARPGSADLVVIERWPADMAIARRALVAGGRLLAVLPSDPSAWDALRAARLSGLRHAEILRPWSRELGYLTPIFLLQATAPGA